MEQKKNGSTLWGSIMVLGASFIWGTTFVAQEAASESISPLFYNACRSFVACVFLAFVIFIFDRTPYVTYKPPTKAKKLFLIRSGIICGTLLALASFLQQYGLSFTTAGKASFITAFYIILVPIVEMVMGRKTPFFVKISVVLALIGLYLLCIKEGLSANTGDILMIGCAVVFTAQIMAVDRYSPHMDGMRLSFVQFFTVGVLSLAFSFVFEAPSTDQIIQNVAPILYAGIMSSGIAYTLQILAQARLNPTVASILMSMESLFGALSSAIILGERMSSREIAGAVIMFSAIIFSQLPSPPKTINMKKV